MEAVESVMKLSKSLINKRNIILKIIYLLTCIYSLVSCASMAQLFTRYNDTLDKYEYSDFYNMDTSLRSKYPFIHFDQNVFKFYTELSPNWQNLYLNIRKMVYEKDRKLNFYHIGGSHLQADVYTHDIRTKMQTTWEGVPGERGFLFPFDLAKSNNPANYEFSSSNSWKSYRSVGKEFCELNYGLLGAIVTCSDSLIDLHFRYDKSDVKPGFSRVRIFHNKGEFPYDFNFGEIQTCVIERRDNPEIGYTDIFFADCIDSFDLKMNRNRVKPFDVQISGIQLTNQQPGISYTAIGVNGAALFTYLECGNFEEQLRQSQPDLFAFSVGTNDANVPFDKFDPLIYKANLEKMIQIVLKANPNCAILLTVPNDSYYLKKHLNKNIDRQREVIKELAIQYQCPVWDLYGLMGELGSSKTWEDEGLMKPDKVHFTTIGYHLKGDLYFDAFMKWLEQMDNQKLKRKK